MTPEEEINQDFAASEAGEPHEKTEGTELCVPSTVLEVGDEADKSAPEVGDSVDFTATGKVSRVEGGMIYVEVTSINGEPIGPGDDAPPMNEEQQFEADMASTPKPAPFS